MVSRLLVFARVYRLASLINFCAPCAKLQFPKIPLALGRGMWHTVCVLPLKGEVELDLRIEELCDTISANLEKTTV